MAAKAELGAAGAELPFLGSLPGAAAGPGGVPACGRGNDAVFAGPEGNTIYTRFGQDNNFQGLAKSTDGGHSWTMLRGSARGLLARNAANSRARGVSALPDQPDSAWAVFGTKLYATSDGGASWIGVLDQPGLSWIAGSGQTLYISATKGVCRSEDGRNFTLMEGSPSDARRLALDPNDPGTLYATKWRKTGSGLWRYRNNEWTRLNPDYYIYDLAVDPFDSSRLVFCTSDDPYHDVSGAIGANAFPAGVFMIDEGWFSHYGNLDFDRGRFPDAKAMMDELHSLGLPVMLWVCPYITPDGPFFKDLMLDHTRKNRTVWLVNGSNPRQPAIMEWWDGYSAVLDLTNPTGKQWFKAQLDRLMKVYGVDGFKFDGGDATYYAAKSMLMAPRAFDPSVTPNGHSEEFARLGLDYPLNEYRATWKMGGQPLAQRLRDKNHDWADLRKLIPGILNQGLMGYAFNCPDLIGGGEYLSFRDARSIDEELMVRAAQVHALMPMMQFSAAPWRVLHAENLRSAREAARLHEKLGPEILALAKRAAASGEPIVRSLEYQYPNQGYGDIVDQFLLGEEILVAPVLEKGAAARTVLFPPGTWRGDDGSLVRGPSKEAVNARLARLPWWRRVKD